MSNSLTGPRDHRDSHLGHSPNNDAVNGWVGPHLLDIRATARLHRASPMTVTKIAREAAPEIIAA